MKRVVEFDSDPEWNLSGGDHIWHSKISIDLYWISSACPYYADATSITLAGSPRSLLIRIHYNDFMALWLGKTESVAGTRWM